MIRRGDTVRQGGRLAALSLAVAATSANACLPPPPSPQRENETVEQWQARITDEAERERLSTARAIETRRFDAARKVYLARIIESKEVATKHFRYGRQATLTPLSAIKGVLPSKPVTLRSTTLTSCGPEGEGSAVWAPVAALVIVFEGVEPYDFRRLTNWSLLPKEVQDERIALPVRAFHQKNPHFGTWEAE